MTKMTQIFFNFGADGNVAYDDTAEMKMNHYKICQTV